MKPSTRKTLDGQPPPITSADVTGGVPMSVAVAVAVAHQQGPPLTALDRSEANEGATQTSSLTTT